MDSPTYTEASPVQVLAAHLRRLQIESGAPSVRDLERLTAKVGTPYTRGTIQDKLTGRSAAAWEFVEAFVNACALRTGADGDPDLREWRTWHSRMVREVAAARAGRQRPALPAVCPYQRLEPFTAERAEWFHGRETAVQLVLAMLAAHRPGVLLLGPSGAGKSSLARRPACCPRSPRASYMAAICGARQWSGPAAASPPGATRCWRTCPPPAARSHVSY